MKITYLGVLVLWGISVQCMERTLSGYDFYAAIRGNDQKTIQSWIVMARDGKIDVNTKDQDDGRTALMLAGGFVEVVRELLKVPGIDVNARNNQGWTALMEAARYERTEVVRELLKAPGIDVNAQDNDGWTALMEAARVGRTEVVRELLKAPGIDVNARNNQGLTALMQAAGDGFVEVVIELLKAPGIDVNAQDNDGWTALMLAARDGFVKVVIELLKFPGIDVNARNNQSWTTLMLAVMWSVVYGRTEVVIELLKVPGVDVNAQAQDGLTALMQAAENGFVEVVRELVKVPGIDVNIKNAEGHSALAIAIKKSQGQIALLLWAVGAHEEGIQELSLEMEEVREEGKAVFNGIKSALKSGSIDALKKYAEDRFSLMIIDSQGNNPMHSAVMQNQREVARWLIDYRKQWLVERNKDELNPLDVIYGRWITEGNNEWGSFVEKLPEEFKPDAEKAKKDWQRYKEKAFNEGYEGMAASLLKK